ncbi:MAG: glutamine--tRNA ligase, partial [Acidobacteria bacterium]|nr:glutamine--tRNA ligase [Acidobacteriota bacterium]
GYFYLEPEGSTPDRPVYNRIVTLKDTWARISSQASKPEPRKAAAAKAVPAKESRSRETSLEGSKPRPPQPRTEELEARARSYQEELGLSEQDAVTLTSEEAVADFFDAARAAHEAPKSVANWVLNELLRELKGRTVADLPFDGTSLGALVAMIDGGKISGRTAKQVFEKMLAGDGSPEDIVHHHGWAQIEDEGELQALIEGVIERFPDQLEQFRAGKESLFGFFVGQVMKASHGRAHPELLSRLLRDRLAP